MKLMAITWSTRGRWRARGGALGAAAATLAAAAATLAVTAAAAAATTTRSTYAGIGRHGADSMEIGLKTIDGGRRTQWQVTVTGPCNAPDVGLGRGLGYGSGDRYAPLRIQRGRFTISRHGAMSGTDITYHYTLSGHHVRNGFAGTFHYVEVSTSTDPSTVCNSTLLHWTARPSSRPFA